MGLEALLWQRFLYCMGNDLCKITIFLIVICLLIPVSIAGGKKSGDLFYVKQISYCYLSSLCQGMSDLKENSLQVSGGVVPELLPNSS